MSSIDAFVCMTISLVNQVVTGCNCGGGLGGRWIEMGSLWGELRSLWWIWDCCGASLGHSGLMRGRGGLMWGCCGLVWWWCLFLGGLIIQVHVFFVPR